MLITWCFATSLVSLVVTNLSNIEITAMWELFKCGSSKQSSTSPTHHFTVAFGVPSPPPLLSHKNLNKHMISDELEESTDVDVFCLNRSDKFDTSKNKTHSISLQFIVTFPKHSKMGLWKGLVAPNYQIYRTWTESPGKYVLQFWHVSLKDRQAHSRNSG